MWTRNIFIIKDEATSLGYILFSIRPSVMYIRPSEITVISSLSACHSSEHLFCYKSISKLWYFTWQMNIFIIFYDDSTR